MLAIVLLVTGGLLAARWYGNTILFSRTRLESYDPDKFPIKIQNGVSYIYDRPEAETVVIFSHGSGGDLTGRQKIRDMFYSTNYGLIIYDYYGYGASQNVPTLLMNETALTRAIDEIAKLTKGKKIILLGASLGCFPSCWLASQRPKNLFGLILCVPFDSLSSFSKTIPYLLGSYNNLALCKKINVPTIVVRADHDQLIPVYAADRIITTLGNKGHLITVPTDHQDYLTEQLMRRIISFIKQEIQIKKKYSE